MTTAGLTVLLKRLRRHAALMGGLFAGAAALSVNRAFTGRFLDAIGTDVSVAGVVAVAMTAAAAFRCGWHWRCPVLRPLGGTFMFVAVYQLVVLVSYEPASRAWGIFGAALWPAIPLAYAAWGSAALAISFRARGVQIGLATDWHRYRLHGALLAGRWVPRPAHLWLWVPAIVFSGMSFVPGWVYSGTAVPGVTWHGQPYQPHVLYGLISGWGVVMLFGSALIAEHGWRTQRPGLDEGDRVLVRGTVVVSFVAAVCALVLSASSLSGFWPEPVIDLLLGLFAVVYTVLVTAGDDRLGICSPWPSRQYVLENTVVIALSTLLALTTTRSPAMRGLEAAAFTGLFTLFILSVKHVRDASSTPDGEPARGLARFAAAEHAGLRELLAGVDGHILRLWVTSLPVSGMSASVSQLKDEDRRRVEAFAAALPARLGEDATPRLLRLFYETALVLPDRPTARRSLDPPPMLVVRVQTARRAEVTIDPDEMPRLQQQELQFRLFLKSQPKSADGLPHYRYQGQISEMSEQELIDALAPLRSRREGRPKRASSMLLELGLSEIRVRLLDELA